MRCVGWTTYGDPNVMGIHELPDPEPGPGEVVIAVEAATVNPADISFREGLLAGLITGPSPWVAGLEVAGTVAKAGAGSRWKVGDRVAAIVSFIPGGRGGHCELVRAPDDCLARIPGGRSALEATLIPMSGLTAQLALDRAGAGPGSVVAVTGAVGAVGGFTVELAKAAGAKVVAVVGEEYQERVRKLGADDVVLRGDDAPAQIRTLHPRGVDALIDAAVIGGAMQAAVKDGGHFICVRPFVGTLERGIQVDHISVSAHGPRDKLGGLMRLWSEGRLTPVVGATYAPSAAADAHRRLAQGGLGGRVVLDFSSA